MKLLRELLVGLFVLLPIGFAISIPLMPLPVELSNANVEAQHALITGSAKQESEALQVVLKYSPWQGALWQRLGRLQLDDGRFSEAAISFKSANAAGQLSAEGMLWMADALVSNGESGQAKEWLRRLSTERDIDPLLFLQSAIMQRSINDPFGALNTLLKAYTTEPLNSEINFQLGLQLSASQPDSAVKFLKQASQLDSSRKGVCDSLVNMIEKSKAINNSAERFIYIGQVLSTFGEWDIAQRAFQTATEISPENAAAWALLSEAAQQNNIDGLAYLMKARQLAPDAEIVNGISALYYRRQGKIDLALTYLEKALAANPGASVWEIEIGNTQAEIGDLRTALGHFQNAAKINPLDWAPLRALASFCITYNYEVDTIGLPAANQALELNPGSPALMDLLGTGLMISGDLDGAEAFFLKADKIDPNQSAILIHLGQLYLAKGEDETAFAYLRQAAEFAQDSRLREMANRLLIENGGR